MRRFATLGLAVSFAFVGCSSISVRHDYEPSQVDAMQAYTTYSWLSLPQRDDPRIHNEIVENRVVEAVDTELAAKGYEKVADGADFKVGYHVALSSAIAVTQVNEYYGYGYRYWRPYSAYGFTNTYVTEYQQGTLIVDVVDTNSDELVWRGFAQSEVSPTSDPEKNRGKINKAVEKIFAKFPPEK